MSQLSGGEVRHGVPIVSCHKALFRQVLLQLTVLGMVALVSPTQCQLIALYITGLILLDKRQNAKRITHYLVQRPLAYQIP